MISDKALRAEVPQVDLAWDFCLGWYNEEKGRVLDKAWSIVNIIIGIMIIVIIPVGKLALGNQEDIAYDTYEEGCREIWCVRSITVEDDSILIEFDTNLGGFQVVYAIEEDGAVKPLEYGSDFTLEIGQRIGWGDGDHAFASLALEDIKDSTAFIIIGDEHRPPVSLEHLEYSKFRKCKIQGRWP